MVNATLLRNLIAANRLDEVFNELLLSTQANPTWRSAYILNKNRWEELSRQKILGVLSFDDDNRRRNQIVAAVLELIDKIESGETQVANTTVNTTNPEPPVTLSSTGTGNDGNPTNDSGSGTGNGATGTGDGGVPINKIPLWIGGIAGLAMLGMAALFNCPTEAQYVVLRGATALAFGGLGSFFLGSLKLNFKGIEAGGALAFAVIGFLWNPAEGFVGKNCNEPFSVTVFVHGKGGRQDMILRQQGKVIMDLAGERREEPIQGNGEAIFQNLPPTYNGKQVSLNVDFSEPYKSIYPDSLFPLKPGEQIYLPVALQGLDRIFGTVIWKEKPLLGVVVSIGNALADTTDANGAYELRIPEVQQRKEQEVKFVKPGFKMQLKKAFPQTQEPLNVVMEKSN